MPTILDIMQAIDHMAPFSTAMPWDNSGLLVGSPATEVTGCILALDVTKEAISLAKQKGANLLITHHPAIFTPVRSLSPNDIPYQLIQNGLSLLSAHTNLDLAKEGVNAALAATLSLSDLEPFANADHIGLTGILPQAFSPRELALFLKERLHAIQVEFTGGRESIRRIAIVSGAGGDYLSDALRSQADAYVTGEVKHNIWIDAIHANYPLFAAGHHATEAVVLKPLQEKLQRHFPCLLFDRSLHFPVYSC